MNARDDAEVLRFHLPSDPPGRRIRAAAIRAGRDADHQRRAARSARRHRARSTIRGSPSKFSEVLAAVRAGCGACPLDPGDRGQHPRSHAANGGVPYVVTVHDAWWLCAAAVHGPRRRTLLLPERGSTSISAAPAFPRRHSCPNGCICCSTRLRGAALVLSPSRSHAALYAANGIDPDRLRVQPNGIRLPSEPRPLRLRASAGAVRLCRGRPGDQRVSSWFVAAFEGLPRPIGN